MWVEECCMIYSARRCCGEIRSRLMTCSCRWYDARCRRCPHSPQPQGRCRDKFLPAVKFFPPPVTLPSVLSAVCMVQNLYLADSLPIE